MGVALDTKTLATEIRAAHERTHAAVVSALEHAKEAGRLLTDARQQIPHGGWIAFVEQEVGISRSAAAGYIRVFNRWPQLAPNVERVAHLPLRQALKRLAEPKPVVAVDLMAEGDADQERMEALKRTLEKPDVTVAELQALVDEATRLMARATERRASAEREFNRIVPPNMCLIAEDAVDGMTRVAYIHPFTDPAFVFYNVMTDLPDGGATFDGGKRAIRRDLVFDTLREFHKYPVESANWKIKKANEPWTYNEWMFDSHEDYVQQVNLGRIGYVDSPYLYTSPEEHKAFIDRIMRTEGRTA